MTMRPEPGEYGPYYSGYVNRVPEDDVVGAIETQSAETQKLLSALDDARAAFRYATGKWSIKEVIGHLSDAERVFGYRALAIARGEEQPLPGFDENAYIGTASYDSWSLGQLVEQYALLRRANIVLFRNLPQDAWSRRGIASGSPVTVRALAAIIVGHERHHVSVLRERYGV